MTVTARPQSPAPPLRLLLVEPDSADRQLIRDLLDQVREVRFTLDWARDLAAGIERLDDGRFDVALVAQDLPDGEGLQLVRIAATRGAAAPLIVLGPDDCLELDHEAMALGAAGFIEKSRLDGIHLERTIRYAIKHRRDAERLCHLAQRDELTGLANRALFRDRLDCALASARRHDKLAAVMIIDLNGFKQVNDGIGHEAGDLLLRTMADRMTSRLRETDTVARLGGDEFALIIEDLAKADYAALVAEKVLATLAPPVTLLGQEVQVTASIGITLYPRDCGNAEGLVRLADRAMYQAKAEGGHRYRFGSEQIEQRVHRRRTLGSRLKQALEADDLSLSYYPQVGLNADRTGAGRVWMTGDIAWQAEGEATLDSRRILALAEDHGFIDPLTDWMLATAAGQIRRWQKQGLDQVRIALPLPPRRMLDWQRLGRRTELMIAKAGIEPSCLELDLDETLVLADMSAGGNGLSALKGTGVRLALDGFGRSSASLKELRSDLLDSLKLDPHLYRELPGDARREILVRTVIGLGRALRLRVVANDVRNQAELAFLREAGCDAAQVQADCPPLPAELCTSWLKQARPVRAGLPPRGAIEPILPPQDSAGQGPAPQTPGKHSRDQRNMNQKM